MEVEHHVQAAHNGTPKGGPPGILGDLPTDHPIRSLINYSSLERGSRIMHMSDVKVVHISTSLYVVVMIRLNVQLIHFLVGVILCIICTGCGDLICLLFMRSRKDEIGRPLAAW